MIKAYPILGLLLLLSSYARAQDRSTQQKLEAIVRSTDREIELLKVYISDIADKTIPEPVRTRKINRVLKKFDPTATIEVTSLIDRRPRQLPAQRYFYRLRDNLTYANIAIEWIQDQPLTGARFSDLGYGVYELIGRYIQVFKGLDERGETIYGDITIKKVTVKVSERIDQLTKRQYQEIKFMKIEAEATLPLDQLDELLPQSDSN